MTKFRNMILKWFLGIGGRNGRSTLFKHWNAAKLEKYDVDSEKYDLTNMTERPSILIENDQNHRTPYLTMIYL